MGWLDSQCCQGGGSLKLRRVLVDPLFHCGADASLLLWIRNSLKYLALLKAARGEAFGRKWWRREFRGTGGVRGKDFGKRVAAENYLRDKTRWGWAVLCWLVGWWLDLLCIQVTLCHYVGCNWWSISIVKGKHAVLEGERKQNLMSTFCVKIKNFQIDEAMANN